jgi:5'-3' exonuclease
MMYKGNRVQDPSFSYFYQLIDDFKNTVRAHTSICCLEVETMEADDVIAAYCQINAREGSEIFIVSGDKDFTQLLKLPGVHLVNPDNGKLRNQKGDKDYVEDLDYWIFLKCIRGDMGDYVPAAFPRVRETRVKLAYVNDYERMNLMNETWTERIEYQDPVTTALVQEEIKHRVGDLYEHNVVLLDLFNQPDEQRALLLNGVAEQTEMLGTYSHFHFLRFLDSHQLNRLRDDAMKYVELFANNQRFLNGEAKPKTALNREEKAAVHEATVDETPLVRQGLLNF